jgi:hypothetical protein
LKSLPCVADISRLFRTHPAWEEEEEEASKDVLRDKGVHDVHLCDIGGDLDRVIVWFWDLQKWVS